MDNYIQYHPPNFNETAQLQLESAIYQRYTEGDTPPPEVLAALYLRHLVLGGNKLVTALFQGASVQGTNEEQLVQHLRGARFDEDEVSGAILYSAISIEPKIQPIILVEALRRILPRDFRWDKVIDGFDEPHLRISAPQFLNIYKALQHIAEGGEQLVLQHLWDGSWQQSETQLSFMTAYASFSPAELGTLPTSGLGNLVSIEMYANTEVEVQDRSKSLEILERARFAVTHPLWSSACIQAIFRIALASTAASDTMEARRLFQTVIISNLDIFMVSAFAAVPKPWSLVANDTLGSLFGRFLDKSQKNYNFVLYSLWHIDRAWLQGRLEEVHSLNPLLLETMLEHALNYGWLRDLVSSRPCGFTMDLAALAHALHHLDTSDLRLLNDQNSHNFPTTITAFLSIKAEHEMSFKDNGIMLSVTLPVRTVSALLNLMTEVLPVTPTPESMLIQRKCITAYPRLINYGGEFDNIIDANGSSSNTLPPEANRRMEEHYKRMYSDEVKVVDILDALRDYKNSRDATDQDIFACMIHGLFDEYALYHTYPLEALKTTALLFGGIIRYKLLDNLPLEVALGMIYDAIKDHTPEESMYKFGLQALTQTMEHFDEWPGLCRQLVQIPHLRGTEAFARAEQVALRDVESGLSRSGQAVNGDKMTNGNSEEKTATKPGFKSINADSPPPGLSEEPSEDIQERVLFVLNNVTEDNLSSKFAELESAMDDRYQAWFASHLVEARAKMQPNYHQLYLRIVQQFENKTLWAEVLRETYVSVVRMLNADSTASMASERTLLRNLGDWLGSLTLARDQPIRHRNVAFKQLLHEGFHSQRLVVVLPFVCKVLAKAKGSLIFTASNPWILDILKCLAELYQTDMKLNLKFEIEVLCKTLGITLGSIEPWSELQTLLPAIEESLDSTLEIVESFDALSVNGMGGGIGGGLNSGRFSPQDITSSLPDLSNLLQYPPANDMVDQQQLREIVKSAITRAVIEIISPVVERSVTIAAISTSQMITKDFATEPDENRVRAAAIHMVKRTAGALALVTSKEPLRASMTNYIRALSQNLAQGLPEGTIIISVNANLDLACGLVEKKAEERAIPEIEDMIEHMLEVRRQHRARGGREPFVDHSVVNRWAMTIPVPYKLVPNGSGLNQEQMAIYDEFARQPRIAAPSSVIHGPSASDATRNMANEILQENYNPSSQLTAVDAPPVAHLGLVQQSYVQPQTPMTNGRGLPMDFEGFAQKIIELLDNLMIAAASTTEDRIDDLPANMNGHPVISLMDNILQLLIRYAQVGGLDPLKFVMDQANTRLFSSCEDHLALEALIHISLEVAKLAPGLTRVLLVNIETQPDDALLSTPLASILLEYKLIDLHRIDTAAAKGLLAHSEPALTFLSELMHKTLLNDRPTALRTDFANSLEALSQWAHEDPEMSLVQDLLASLKAHGMPQGLDRELANRSAGHREQIEYVFQEWKQLCSRSDTTDIVFSVFIDQIHNKQIMNDVDTTCIFLRVCLDGSIDYWERFPEDGISTSPEAQYPIDALAKLIVWLVKERGRRSHEVKLNAAEYLRSLLSIVVLVLNHHYVQRGEHFNQKAFFRLFSTILTEFEPFLQQANVALEPVEIYGVFASIFLMLGPRHYAGFFFAWIGLVSHRCFLPRFLALRNVDGWAPMVDLIESLLVYVGELTKPVHPVPILRGIYEAAIKTLMALNQDWPLLLASHHARLCQAISSSCTQVINLILTATPDNVRIPDILNQPGIKLDRIEESRQAPVIADRDMVFNLLREEGLLDLIDQALNNGPSEDAVAHVAHAMQSKRGQQTSVGHVPVNANIKLIDAVVLYIGISSTDKAISKGAPLFVTASPDAALLNMLVHELNFEAKYYFLTSMVNQLRYPSSHTHYFVQALLEVFGSDMNDPEDMDIRQQIVRIILERAIGHWPQPWGLILAVAELVKNDKYNFFELPFIKTDHEVSSIFPP